MNIKPTLKAETSKTTGNTPSPASNRPPSKVSAKEAARAAAAERARRFRERKRALENPEQVKAEAEAKSRAEAEERAAKEAEEQAKAERLANLQNTLVDAIAGTVEAVAEGAQKLWMDQDGPHLGNSRSRKIAEGWAPILAPYISEANIKYLPLILAATGTTGALLQWSGEYAEYRKAMKSQVSKPKEEKISAAA